MARYLITGGAGFIGGHLCAALSAAGHDIRILDDLSSGSIENVPANAEMVIGDAGDLETVKAAVQECDGVFHLAAIAAVARCTDAWADAHRVNVGATVAVLQAVRDVHGTSVPVVYASSAAVYGATPADPIAESTPPRPLSAYGCDKLASEQHARIAGSLHGVPTFGLRFFNVYGPGQDPRSPYSGVIAVFADRLARGLPVTLHGDGGQTRDFVYVGDVVQHLIRAMHWAAPDAPVANVCTGQSTSVRELAEMLGTILGVEPDIRVGPPRPGDIRHSLGNPIGAFMALGIQARTTPAEGLQFLRLTPNSAKAA